MPPTSSSSSANTGIPTSPVLDVHRGAIDQTTITTEPPPSVMKRVREVLQSMGVVVQSESEYRYRCIRPRRLADDERPVNGQGLLASRVPEGDADSMNRIPRLTAAVSQPTRSESTMRH